MLQERWKFNGFVFGKHDISLIFYLLLYIRFFPIVRLSVVLVNTPDKISLRFVILKYNISSFQYCTQNNLYYHGSM